VLPTFTYRRRSRRNVFLPSATWAELDVTADCSLGYPVVTCPLCDHVNHLRHVQGKFAFRCRQCDQALKISSQPLGVDPLA
jgi:hypothetical protein